MKNNKLKVKGYESEDTKEIRNLIIITLIIVVLGVGLYFFTDKVVKKDSTTDTPVAEFDYSAATVGTMFNRPYDEYYVFLYDSKSDNASNYKSLFDKYDAKENAKKIYFVDLSLKFNSPYVSDTSNKKPTNATEVKVKESALVLINNGKVSKYYESLTDYEKVLN